MLSGQTSPKEVMDKQMHQKDIDAEELFENLTQFLDVAMRCRRLVEDELDPIQIVEPDLTQTALDEIRALVGVEEIIALAEELKASFEVAELRKQAGLKSGDVIISMNGNKISSFGELRAKVATLGAGRKAELGLLRDGKERTVSVTLQEISTGQVAASQMHPMLEGAQLSNADGGVKVGSVDERSAAAQIGLVEGDMIIGVNRQRINNVADLRKALDNRSGVAACAARGIDAHAASNDSGLPQSSNSAAALICENNRGCILALAAYRAGAPSGSNPASRR